MVNALGRDNEMSAIEDGVHGGGGGDPSQTPRLSTLAMVIWILAIVVVADVVVVAQQFLG
jgi:hypothetical protein